MPNRLICYARVDCPALNLLNQLEDEQYREAAAVDSLRQQIYAEMAWLEQELFQGTTTNGHAPSWHPVFLAWDIAFRQAHLEQGHYGAVSICRAVSIRF